MEFKFDELAFVMDCPATPLSHISSNEKMENKLIQVTIYITRACNLNCTHCYISAGRPLNNELNYYEWKNVIDQLKYMKIKIIYILGGEPLLRNDIFDIIKYSSSLGIYTAMSTNGTLINKTTAKKLKDTEINEVQVSIDGPNEEINSVLRGKGNFNLAINGVKNLVDENIKTTLSYVITDSNKDYIKDMVDLAIKLNVNSINFSPVQYFGRAKINKIRISRKYAIESYKLLKKLSEENKKIKITINGFRFYLDNLDEVYNSLIKKGLSNYYSCPAGRSRFIIDSNGDIYGCELLINRKFLEGNVRKNRIEDIWINGFKQFREDRWKKINYCSTCEISSLCQGGCVARAFNGENIYNKDPLCNFNVEHL